MQDEGDLTIHKIKFPILKLPSNPPIFKVRNIRDLYIASILEMH